MKKIKILVIIKKGDYLFTYKFFLFEYLKNLRIKLNKIP